MRSGGLESFLCPVVFITGTRTARRTGAVFFSLRSDVVIPRNWSLTRHADDHEHDIRACIGQVREYILYYTYSVHAR